MIFSGHTLQFSNTKTNTKVSSINVLSIKKCVQWFCSLTVWISEKERHLSDQYFNGSLWSLNLWHLKFILFIDSFPISPVCQPASQANWSGNKPANQSINLWLSVNQFICHTVSQSVSNWAHQPVNWSEVLKEVSLYLKQQVSQAISKSSN